MISVDRVYQTVQKILNKEQRGYLPPIEFNLFANQAQIEIFENYFYDQDAYLAGGMNDSDYADIVRNLEEKISFFENTVEIPTTRFVNGVWRYPDNFYRLGRVLVSVATRTSRYISPENIQNTVSYQTPVIADEVSHKEASYVNLSPLTAPTMKQPIYVRTEGGIRISPELDMDEPNMQATSGNQILMVEYDSVRMNYIRRPAEVHWSYINVNGRAMYNASASDNQNFELHPSELPILILKICALAGVAIRSLDVAQIIQGEEQSLVNEQKQ